MPYSASEPFDGRIPITSSSVSYGFPTGERSSSPGRRLLMSASASACVPHVIWGLTSASSVWKIDAYTASSASLPISLYPYPVVPSRHASLTLLSCIALSTFSWLYSAFRSISSKRGFRLSRISLLKRYTLSEMPSSLYMPRADGFSSFVIFIIVSFLYFESLMLCSYSSTLFRVPYFEYLISSTLF